MLSISKYVQKFKVISIVKTLKEFQTYLKNPTAHSFDRLKYYNKETAILQRDFYNTRINQAPGANDAIQSILRALHVPHEKWGRFLDTPLNFYNFFNEVQDLLPQRNKKLQELLEFVETHNEQYKKKCRNWAVATVAFFGFLPPAIIFFGSSSLTLIQSLLAITIFVPSVSILYTAGVALYSLYRSSKDTKLAYGDRFRENFFLLLRTTMKITAYSILIAAATTFNPLAAVFFLMASLSDVGKQVVHLRELNQKESQYADSAPRPTLYSNQKEARLTILRAEKREEVRIAVAAAVSMATIVAVMFFVPAGPLASLLGLVAVALVTMGQKWANHRVQSSSHEKMQQRFNELEEEYNHGLQKVHKIEVKPNEIDPSYKSIAWRTRPKKSTENENEIEMLTFNAKNDNAPTVTR